MPQLSNKNPYLKLRIENDKVNIATPLKTEPILNDLLNKENIIYLKKEMDKYVGEEKKFQSDLINKNNETVLDTEVAMTNIKDENIRMDIVNLDKNYEKIVGIELKHFGDKRLYNKEIGEQLKKYNKYFSKDNIQKIRNAYQNVIKVKEKIGLIEKDSFLSKMANKDLKVETKPILIVLCYEQTIIYIVKKN